MSFADGYCAVSIKDTNIEYRIPLADAERVRAEWKSAVTHVRFLCMDGSDVELLRALISGIEVRTAETVQRTLELRREEKRFEQRIEDGY